MTHTFSIKEALQFGWEKTRKHSGLLFQVVITLFAVQILSSIAGEVLEGTIDGIFAALLAAIVGAVIGVGAMRIVLKIATHQHTSYADIIPPLGLVWQYVVVTFFAALIIFLGLILLIIPGIYFALRYMFVRFAVLEGAGIKGSLSQSAKMTQGIKWKLLGFMLVLGLVNILGFLALIIGLLVTIPVTLIAYAHVYTVLKKSLPTEGATETAR